MRRCILIFTIFIAAIYLAYGQADGLTVAEETDYSSTSTYSDVIKFIANLQEQSPFVKIDTIAQSIEGRIVPMMIIANPLPENPKQVGDRIVVYIQANIHAGEVEGKEASLMLARDLLKNPSSEIMKNVVTLIVPIL
ncbi:MAG TPA: M14 family zinc carboxypeptidase, partial [Bacteroidales bacterium]|nr:M14 family zinc carboxypeptidase [Bacteroidales bacterium]